MLPEQSTNIGLCYAAYGYVLEIGRIVLNGAVEVLLNNADAKSVIPV
jgi:ABC-type branched-subunit amino acid transport system ATPase component